MYMSHNFLANHAVLSRVHNDCTLGIIIIPFITEELIEDKKKQWRIQGGESGANSPPSRARLINS